MAFRLSVSATFYRAGNVVDVPVSVIDDTDTPRTDVIESGEVSLLYGLGRVLMTQRFSRFNGTNQGFASVSFINPVFIRQLSVQVSITLGDSTELRALIPVVLDNSIPTEDAPLNPNSLAKEPVNNIL